MKLFNLFKKSKPAKLVFRTISDLDLIKASRTQVPMLRYPSEWVDDDRKTVKTTYNDLFLN